MSTDQHLAVIKCEFETLGLSPDLDRLLSLDKDSYIQNYLNSFDRLRGDQFEYDTCFLYLQDVARRLMNLKHPTRPPSNREFNIRKFNCPRGIEFCEELRGYYFVVSVDGAGEIRSRPRRDLEPTISLREQVMEMIEQGASVEVVKSLLVESRDNDPSYSVAASIDALNEITPEKSVSSKKRKLSNQSATPMSVPHKVFSNKENMEILKFRDKYYSRIPILGDFVNTPMRSTRTEVESDYAVIANEISREDPPDYEKIKNFVSTLALTVSQPISTALTPQPARKSSLPPCVKKTPDGSYYAILNLFGDTFTTPQRTHVNQVLEDRDKLDTEVKRLRALMSASKNQSSKNPSVVRAIDRFINGLAPTNNSALPLIHKIRDKYYTTIDVMGQAVSTPLRSSLPEVEIDRDIASIVLKAGSAMDKNALVNEIKNRWMNGDQERTPVKTNPGP
jgi:hypothetical protein